MSHDIKLLTRNYYRNDNPLRQLFLENWQPSIQPVTLSETTEIRKSQILLYLREIYQSNRQYQIILVPIYSLKQATKTLEMSSEDKILTTKSTKAGDRILASLPPVYLFIHIEWHPMLIKCCIQLRHNANRRIRTRPSTNYVTIPRRNTRNVNEITSRR